MIRTFIFVALGLLLAAAPAGAADSPIANAVLARAGSDPVILWDASKVIAAMLHDGKTDETILREVESDAILAAVARSPKLKSAKTITVRVIYARTGDVSPVYKTMTYTGFEKLLDVVTPSEIAEKGDEKATAIKAGKTPADITILMTGKLPPR